MKQHFILSVCAVFIACACPVLAQRVEAGRSVIITIQGVPPEQKQTIDATYPVSEGGTINLPHIGRMQAAGLTSEALAAKIETKFKSEGIFTTPTIQVAANGLQRGDVQLVVHVAGQVQKNGPTPYTPNLTVFQAVAAAGGPTPFGAMNRVVLSRDGKQEEINLKTPAGQAVKLQANDTITVPQKGPLGN